MNKCMVENVEDHTSFIPVANFVSELCGKNKLGIDYTGWFQKVIVAYLVL